MQIFLAIVEELQHLWFMPVDVLNGLCKPASLSTNIILQERFKTDMKTFTVKPNFSAFLPRVLFDNIR